MQSVVWSGDQAVTQPWGCTSLTVEPYWKAAQCHWHCGIDIGLMKDMRVHAARDGVVTYVGYGLLAIASGTQTDWYVHIDSAKVAIGAAVTRGDLVAYSGDKVPSGGFLTGPHLHFEIQDAALGTDHLNNPATSVDPVPLLTGVFGSGGGSIGGLFPMAIDQFGVVKADLDQLLTELHVVKADLDQLLGMLEDGTLTKAAALTALAKAGSGGSVNLQPVLDAIKGIQLGSLTPIQAQALIDVHDILTRVFK